MGDREPTQASASTDGGVGADAALVEARLDAIVRAVDGRNVAANGAELWFEPASVPGVQIRLGGDCRARCFARSANFAISYGGRPPSKAASSAFQAVVESIKSIDASRIDDVVAAFATASAAVARRFAQPAGGGAFEAARNASGIAPESVVGSGGGRTASTTVVWEHPRARALNVLFLDLCAQISGRHGEALKPLHWGFWPTDRPAEFDSSAYDPQAAFSECLLAHLPAGVERILDVGCGLGFNTKLLSARNKRVTALSPVAHHCAVIEQAQLPGVDVRCARFEELQPDGAYDLLLFSESLNHFSLDDEFLAHCKRFLADPGFILMADDLAEERARMIETQRVFRVVRRLDITDNVAPTTEWWARQMPLVAAYHNTLLSILALYDPPLEQRVRDIVARLDNNEFTRLFSGEIAPPPPKGRYMIYLLQAD